MTPDEEMVERYKLYSFCLTSKWGFWDGDQFSDLVMDSDLYVKAPYDEKGGWKDGFQSMDHEVLCRLVEKYLIPALPVPVRTERIITCHNPIRVVQEDMEELETQPETVVTLLPHQLVEVMIEVRDEFLAAGGELRQ